MVLGVGNYGAGLRPYPFVGLSGFSGAVHRQGTPSHGSEGPALAAHALFSSTQKEDKCLAEQSENLEAPLGHIGSHTPYPVAFACQLKSTLHFQ